jgi:hypothetical protein
MQLLYTNDIMSVDTYIITNDTLVTKLKLREHMEIKGPTVRGI